MEFVGDLEVGGPIDWRQTSLRRWLSAEEFVHLAGRCSRVWPEVR